MTLKEFLKLNTNGGIVDVWLYLDDELIDCYRKEELENSIYINNKVKSFEIDCGDLYISVEHY